MLEEKNTISTIAIPINLELKISSGIPFGYLLNLSVKHYHRKLDKEVKIEKINDLIEMVRHYIALLQLINLAQKIQRLGMRSFDLTLLIRGLHL